MTMRFRTSTNSEDLDGFPCAGCYDSHTGDPADWDDVLDAIRETWASIWLFRTFEERSYHGIDHNAVGMALLVHHNFPDEEANGVALTANPFDPSGLEPGLLRQRAVRRRRRGRAPAAGRHAATSSSTTSRCRASRSSYLSHSNLIAEGETVLTRAQIHELGDGARRDPQALLAGLRPGRGQQRLVRAWTSSSSSTARPGESPQLVIKQARPHPGRGQ